MYTIRLVLCGLCLGFSSLLAEIPPALSPTAPATPLEILAGQIFELKQQGIYNESLWTQYQALAAEHSDRSNLDQGNDLCPAFPVPNVPFVDNGNTTGLQNNFNPNCLSPTSAPDVIYQFTPIQTNSYQISTCGSNFDTGLEIRRSGSCPGSVQVACNDDACGVTGVNSSITTTLIAGATYFIIVDGWNASSGSYSFSINLATPCDVVPQPTDAVECVEIPDSSHLRLDCDGGCNNSTYGGVNTYGHISCGQTVTGVCFTYVRQSQNIRDLDWYQFTLTQPALVSASMIAEFSCQAFITDNNCVSLTTLASAANIACQPANTTPTNLAPGTYNLILGPADFSGIPSPLQYRASLTAMPCPSCNCPNPEQEPNDNFPPAQTIQPGQFFCGNISSPGDFDLVRLNMPAESAIRLILHGNNSVGTCAYGGGLHPGVGIFEETGDPICFAGDTMNQATEFTTDFKLGAYPVVLKIGGARGSTGPYELQIELIQLSLVSPPAPQVTIFPLGPGGQLELRWNASYLPSEQIQIEAATNLNGPYLPLGTVPGNQTTFQTPALQPLEFFRVKAVGNRDADPFVGSILSLDEPGPDVGTGNDVGDYQIQEIERGVTPDNHVVITRLLAQGVGAYTGEYIDQDNRAIYSMGVNPITSFNGHLMGIFGREVMVEHIAYGRDPVSGDIGIIQGRGRNPAGDSLMYFGDLNRFLQPNNGGVSVFWNGWWDIWLDFCPGKCCRLKVIAFCRSSIIGWAPACTGLACPGNPACWLGCPCPPDTTPLCTPPPPGCTYCTLRQDPAFPLRRWCICPSQTIPPAPGFCMFQIWVKCKTYQCPQGIIPCVCEAVPCPGPAVWTLVPFVNSAMHAACKKFCQ